MGYFFEGEQEGPNPSLHGAYTPKCHNKSRNKIILKMINTVKEINRIETV